MTPRYIFQVQNLSIHYQYPGKCHGFGWLWIITESHCRLIHHWDSPVYDNKQVNPFSRVNIKIPPPHCPLLSRAKPRVFMNDSIYLSLHENRDIVRIRWRLLVKSVTNCLKAEISGRRDTIKARMINTTLCHGLKLKM